MNQDNMYSCSSALTVSNSSDRLTHDGTDDGHDSQSNEDVVRQKYVDTDTLSNFTDLTSISQKSDEARKKIQARWDDCLNKKLQTQGLKYQQNPLIDQKTIVHLPLEKVMVKEFLPETEHDPILLILRELFVRSFDQFYKEIEAQLKLSTNTTLVEWLRKTFDDMQEEMLTKKCRCFMLCSSDNKTKNDNKQGIIGFLTLKEEQNGSVYIAQCAVEAESKRRGYGARLLQHLRTIYPPGTFYWGLCRRVNRPAVSFYLKQGAKFMKDDEVANKYKYDPKLYTGFEFVDGTANVQSSASHPPVSPPPSESELKQRSHATYKNTSTMTDPLLDVKKRPLRKKVTCCIIS